ncbi:sugar phosphate isomerase/epimerase [Dyadobacter sp. BE34]|uniref:Sugar phosphate isomerase/epimerase n=1 Tax=Dyadobacter fermentans TaxID=94254 RepID=A0ABU1QZ93_9BACT|nr:MULTISPECIES: sugar phosphate isomerase/epimerase family protein [Dyadobacter]MDR6806479.1 sugar phosphate isomerase/epimerase [Dyadobacter fermentans]MDR7044220.1 sugar phosphate isomerase/epimerase [Dyadobacter sp. BE242]MDR7198531.1 sugar phosphate isomerase/epimerase [Dyadobacter sp. BE34]MDR7216493.1 sugar phosphate isomerase/epimerase [Dyadobacter sp. BE31]MDR7263981.1 sugar phosphate isomerase/epimerase [Dyadobacter sp. BE32]
MDFSRRDFLKKAGATALAASAFTDLFAEPAAKKLWFDISLAEWSLHKELFAKKITNLDFPELAKKEFGISIVEYVNQFFKDKAEDKTYLAELLKRAKDNGVTNHLIMIDGEGGLGELDAAVRNKAVENHYKWVEAAKYLGCKTIRVNAFGKGSDEEIAKAAVEGLSKLGEFASKTGINVIVENHGGSSSNGKWLSGVMKQVNMKNVGTLPDFGNFCIKRSSTGCEESYDRYLGTQELMPFAKGVSAKTYDFDEKGNCIETDYAKILKVVKASGFKGIAGIEYEGSKLSEYDGIKATKALLERVGPTV